MGREYRFPVDVAWDGGRRTTATVDGKLALDIATPPEFRGSDPDVWSPEDAFVAATASCLAVTIAALAETSDLPLHDLDVHAEGVVGRRADGKFGFVRIEQVVDIVTDGRHFDDACDVVLHAEESCLVAVSLNIPVEVSINVHEPARMAVST